MFSVFECLFSCNCQTSQKHLPEIIHVRVTPVQTSDRFKITLMTYAFYFGGINCNSLILIEKLWVI